MSKSITQDMAYRQFFMKYAEKYGVSRASRKYNKSRPEAALERECGLPRLPFRRPHSHPSQHTEAELKLIRDMRRRNPELGMIELCHREDQKRFYSCHAFYSLDDFAKQLAVHNRRSNNAPMRPLRWMSPTELTVQYV